MSTKMEPIAARRRAAERKAKARAMRRLRPTLESPSQPLRPIDVAKAVGKAAHSPKGCSCPMCGNPRKHAKGFWRRTLAEQKQLQREKTVSRARRVASLGRGVTPRGTSGCPARTV